MKKQSDKSKMGLLHVISMAVGTMIGASIFSVFGVGAEIAGKNLPVAFILSGIYAFTVAYSYSSLGKNIISNAGPIAFILKGIGDNIFTGALSVMMWLTYVVSIALFANGFAGYFLPLVNLPVTDLSTGIVIVSLISFFTVLNFFSSHSVGKVELIIVFIKLMILGVFIVFGIISLDISRAMPAADAEHITGTINASVIFFLSYMGFGLITNASENLKNPGKNIPRAIYLSISIVIIIYVLVALTATGNLSINGMIAAKENALAEAAKPFLGNFGFMLISIGALFSIASALNATIYGGANISYTLAKDGELPAVFERKLWFKSIEGLYITSGLAVLFAVLFKVSAIAAITSTIFTIIYLFVIFSHFRLAKKYGGNRFIIVINFILITAVMGSLIHYQYLHNKFALYGTGISIAGAIIVEALFRYAANRKIKKSN